MLDYVSRVADAAHGVLRSDQRMELVARVRARIDRERNGRESVRETARLLAGLGEPRGLVEREVRRLTPGDAREPGRPGNTAPLPENRPAASPAVARGRQGGSGGRPGPVAGVRRFVRFLVDPAATGGRDAATILLARRREVVAMAVLLVAALLVPFDLGGVAIFEAPVLVWGAGAALVLFSGGWTGRDKFIGIVAAPLAYLFGGALVAAARLGEDDGGLGGFFEGFWAYSGVMFMVGAGLGVVRLAYKLLDAR